ncbi:MAG TPA: ATPase, T2SS/T4P/T4SS family, partial [Candidatus Woesebacteria bacterium]|nr:ATPase, T2SS/T4P/T4SS family [Candidatus Woesebacteria bacterium]
MTNTAPTVYRNISEVLLAKNLINQEQAQEIGMRQLKTGDSEETIIKRLRLVSDRDFVEAKAEYLRIPFIDLDKIGFSPEALSLVPEVVAKKYLVAPYKLDPKNKILYVSMVNPLDLETIEFLEKKSGMRVVAGMSVQKQIDDFIGEKYTREKGIATEVGKAVEEQKKEEKAVIEEAEEQVSAEAPVAKIVATILEYAARARASDIHIEPLEENVRIRYRIDGILQEKYLLPRNVHDAVVSRIKILSGMKIDEKRVPQDGRFYFTYQGNEIDLRVSTIPTTYGEKVALRLLQKSIKTPTLPELGLRGLALKNLMTAIERPHGIIIVCGPTGS